MSSTVSKTTTSHPTEAESLKRQVEALKKERDLLSQQLDSLRQRESVWRDALNKIPDPVFIYNVNDDCTWGDLIEANEPACLFTGLSKSALLNLQLSDIETDVDKSDVIDRYRQLEKKGKVTYETGMKTAKENCIPIEATAAKLDLGESEAVLVTVRDVSRRKTTEAELKRNEEKFRKIMDATGYGYFEVDLFGNFTYQNLYASKALGISKNGLIGMNYTEIMDEDNAAKVYLCFHKVYMENLSHSEIEYRVQTGEDHWVDVKAFVAPLRNAENEIIGFGAIARDNTKQLQDERELEKMHKRKIDMAHAAGMAEMASNTLHNVGNVLNSIKISAEIILETFKRGAYDFDNLAKATDLLNKKLNCLEDFVANDPNSKKLFQYLVLFVDSLQKEKTHTLENIDHLLKGIRVVENIIAAQQTYASLGSMMDSYNLEDIVEDSIILKSDMLKRYSIKIEKDFKSAGMVHVQKSKLVHILLNLIKNAADAMVLEPLDQRRLSFSIEQSENSVFLKVKDSGKGIPTDQHQKIFTHGYTTKEDGHGFGLHSCANYMSEMNGKIWVESNENQSGVTFILQFKTKP